MSFNNLWLLFNARSGPDRQGSTKLAEAKTQFALLAEQTLSVFNVRCKTPKANFAMPNSLFPPTLNSIRPVLQIQSEVNVLRK